MGEAVRFRGENRINLDAKGRLAIPARYREELVEHCQGRLIATLSTEDPVLWVYPLPQWEIIEQQIEALPTFNPETRKIKLELIGRAAELEMDGNGRILLPQTLRDAADLDKRVALVGQGAKFELWSEDLWVRSIEQWSEDLRSQGEKDKPEELRSLSL